MRKNIFYKLFFLFAGIITVQQRGFAQFEEGKKEIIFGLPALNGADIAATANNTTTYADAGEDTGRIKNIITFKINENSDVFLLSGFTATVYLKLKTKAILAGSFDSTVKTLTVNYDSATGAKYNVRAYIILPRAEEVQLIVDSIHVSGFSGSWNPIDVLQLENEMRILRYYTLSDNSTYLTPSFNSPVDSTDALLVSWNWDIATHNNMTQLEWAWVEDEMAAVYSGTDSLFGINSTRVDLDYLQDEYKIPLLYDGEGKLYYRVRAVLRKNDGSLITGPWSDPEEFEFEGHEPDLNWQSSTSFAENGKFKSVIRYFDGSLRARQTVTKDNTTGNTVVAETIYDLQGRPNIQILPTPTIENTIKYFKDFNRFIGQGLDGLGVVEDPAKYFDLTPAAVLCNRALALDSNYGNGKYYSNQNPWLGIDSNARFIPDVKGYAFTETRFMDDATQRVRSQGGVGINHQTGSGHETKYYYGKPSQQELDALFATEVGDAGHYSKNMVRDANGQMSVSYVDMHGRTIATALAGDTTTGISGIAADTIDYPAAGVLVNQLTTPLTNIINGNSIESISTILVPATTVYNFTYKLDPSILSMFNCDSVEVCFDCKYDLEISIKSEECGDTTPIIRRYNNLQIVTSNACDTSMGFSGEGETNVKQINFTETLGIGSWVIRKTLTVNDSMFRVRRDSALKVFLCKTEQSIYDSVYAVLYSTSGCGDSTTSTSACDSCSVQLGSFSQYRYAYLAAIAADSTDSTHDAQIHIQYTQDSLECANLCGAINAELTTLLSLRNQMLNDMMPLNGQYAIDSLRDPVTGAATAITSSMAQSKYNIFTTSPGYGSYSKPFYKNPLNENGQSYYYTEERQVDSMIHRHDAGYQPILDTISRDEFSGLFQRSWAGSLIKYHPEYSKLLIAEAVLRRSYEWLDSIQGIDIFSTAAANGFDNPLSLPSASAHPDPFFQIPGNSAYRDTLDKRIREGIIVGAGLTASGPTIWQLANSSVLCAGVDSAGKAACTMALTGAALTGMSPAITNAGLKNRVWEEFRAIYLGYRNEMVLKYMNAQPGVLSRAGMDSLLAEEKQLVFSNMSDAASQNGAGSWWPIAVSGDTTGLGDSTGSSINIFNTDKCLGQMPFWKARLLQCEVLIGFLNNETYGDSAIVNSIIDSILVGMVSVCHNSVDAQHMYGASNVKPSYGGTPQDFEMVVNYVLAVNGLDTAGLDGYFCNPYTIDFPKPYGKNPQVFTNYNNKVDSCECSRFAALKAEAHTLSYDTLSFASMNQFLLANYFDSLSLVLWNGLQQCDSNYVDTCISIWGPADDLPQRPNNLKQSEEGLSLGCSVYIISVEYINRTATDNVRIDYSVGGLYNYIYVVDEYDHYIGWYDAGNSDSAMIISLPPCTNYKFYMQGYYECGSPIDSAFLSVPEYCESCDHPLIHSVDIIPPNPTPYTQNITVHYTIPAGASNCVLLGYAQNSGGYGYLMYTQTLNCDSSFINMEVTACYKYRFIIRSDFDDSCIQIPSNSLLLDSCWRYDSCFRMYNAIVLPEFVVIPSFLNCDYVKPCITCEKLDSLTAEFRDRFPDFSSVPYLGSPLSEDETKQNGLWARFLNYRTGFSKNTHDYLVAYNNCDIEGWPPMNAICSFIKPLNDPTDIFEVDTLPCRNVQTQAEFIAQMLFQKMKDSLIARFDSLYKAKCFSAKNQEQFYASYQPKEYHYTLYYYDQAGNLVKTIPPAGVKPNFDSTHLAAVEAARVAGTDVSTNNTEALATQYRYNTLNQVIAQKTPDAGTSKFWYDRLGRLVVSQNAKQAIPPLGGGGAYSYTLYDELGRITEVGQSTNATAMTQMISRDTAGLAAWISDTSAASKKQVTLTVYDLPYTAVAVTTAGKSGLYQQNLRNRVSYTMVFDDENQKSYLEDGTVSGGNSATYYSYDIHGNVDTLLQDYRTGMGLPACEESETDHPGNRFKKMVYSYDLISGKVNDVAYQPGWADEFYHRYSYDAENRITAVKTSRDKIYWEQEATYSYYRHGPVARTVIGQNQVQGLDYAYTIQGWLKGVNSTSVGTGEYDMGQDGFIPPLGGGGVNSLVARDAYGFSLNYFTGDYTAISSGVTPFITVPMALPPDPVSGISTGHQLFNGNIGAMAVNIDKLSQTLIYGYRYDQLNRIVRMDAFRGFENSDNSFLDPTRLDMYHESVSYDPNGNIRRYLRNGTDGTTDPLEMDSLTYKYYSNTNKLRRVTDAVSSGNYAEDIDNQADTSNYVYDAIGNLTADKAEGIDSIKWTVYGKIKSITKSGGTAINYVYDASGNRISKAVTVSGVTKTTFYVRDASGNVMSIYQAGDNALNNGNLTQTELHLYGSSRLGIYNTGVDVECPVGETIIIFARGNKFFELCNHLGNVLVTVSDKKLPVKNVSDSLINYYLADVVTANDYYPFGMMQPGRKYTTGSTYRFGFNGKENDTDISAGGQDYGLRIYENRLGRFLSVDPLTSSYPYFTPYQFASNSPVELIDIDGGEGGKILIDFFAWAFGDDVSLINEGIGDIREGAGKQIITPRDTHIFTDNNPDYTPGQVITLRQTEGQLQSIDGTAKIAFSIQNISNKVQTVVEVPLIAVDVAKTLLKNPTANLIPKTVKKSTTPEAQKEIDAIRNWGTVEEPKVVSPNKPKGVNNPKVKEALDYGNQKHKELSAKAKAKKGWITGKQFTDPKTGKIVIPDVVTPSGHPLELKPKTPSGTKKGETQLKGQERATGENGRVIYYEPKKKT